MIVINESFGAFTAVITGFIVYRRLNTFYKILFVQLLIWLSLYLVSYLVTTYQQKNALKINNHWVFNLNIVIETLLLLGAARTVIFEKLLKTIVGGIMAFFPVIAIIMYLRSSILVFNVGVYICESILVLVLYVYLVIISFYKSSKIELRNSEVAACVGIILYFGCNLPYFSLFNFLNEHYLALSAKLQDHITDVLSNVRYLLLSLGFLMCNRSHKSLSLK